MASAPESEPFPERHSEAEAAAVAAKHNEDLSTASPASSEAFESAEEEEQETASVTHESSEEKFPLSEETEEQLNETQTEDETKRVTNAGSGKRPVEALAEPGTPPPVASRPRPKTTSAATKSSDLPQTTPRVSISSKPFEPLGTAPKNWRQRALRPTNGKLNRIVQAALLKTLLHAIRRGSVEGVRVAIERGVMVQYIDSRQRNLLMYVSSALGSNENW